MPSPPFAPPAFVQSAAQPGNMPFSLPPPVPPGALPPTQVAPNLLGTLIAVSQASFQLGWQAHELQIASETKHPSTSTLPNQPSRFPVSSSSPTSSSSSPQVSFACSPGLQHIQPILNAIASLNSVQQQTQHQPLQTGQCSKTPATHTTTKPLNIDSSGTRRVPGPLQQHHQHRSQPSPSSHAQPASRASLEAAPRLPANFPPGISNPKSKDQQAPTSVPPATFPEPSVSKTGGPSDILGENARARLSDSKNTRLDKAQRFGSNPSTQLSELPASGDDVIEKRLPLDAPGHIHRTNAGTAHSRSLTDMNSCVGKSPGSYAVTNTPQPSHPPNPHSSEVALNDRNRAGVGPAIPRSPSTTDAVLSENIELRNISDQRLLSEAPESIRRERIGEITSSQSRTNDLKFKTHSVPGTFNTEAEGRNGKAQLDTRKSFSSSEAQRSSKSPHPEFRPARKIPSPGSVQESGAVDRVPTTKLSFGHTGYIPSRVSGNPAEENENIFVLRLSSSKHSRGNNTKAARPNHESSEKDRVVHRGGIPDTSFIGRKGSARSNFKSEHRNLPHGFSVVHSPAGTPDCSNTSNINGYNGKVPGSASNCAKFPNSSATGAVSKKTLHTADKSDVSGRNTRKGPSVTQEKNSVPLKSASAYMPSQEVRGIRSHQSGLSTPNKDNSIKVSLGQHESSLHNKSATAGYGKEDSVKSGSVPSMQAKENLTTNPAGNRNETDRGLVEKPASCSNGDRCGDVPVKTIHAGAKRPRQEPHLTTDMSNMASVTSEVTCAGGGKADIFPGGQHLKTRRLGIERKDVSNSGEQSSRNPQVPEHMNGLQRDRRNLLNGEHETIIQEFVRKYGLLIVERDDNGRVQWLCCKLCPIYGCRSKHINFIMTYMAPFSASEFESHLVAQHPYHWGIFQKLTSNEKIVFLKSKRLPPPEVFKLRVTILKLDQAYVGKRYKLNNFQGPARSQFEVPLSKHSVRDGHIPTCRLKNRSNGLSASNCSKTRLNVSIDVGDGSRNIPNLADKKGDNRTIPADVVTNLSITPENLKDECDCTKRLESLMKPCAVSEEIRRLLRQKSYRACYSSGRYVRDEPVIDLINVNGEEKPCPYIMFALQDSDKTFMKIVWFHLFHGLTPEIIVKLVQGVQGLEQSEGPEASLKVRVWKAADALCLLGVSMLRDLLEKYKCRNWGLTLTTRRCEDLGKSGIEFLVSFLGEDFEVHRFHVISVRTGDCCLKLVRLALDAICPQWRSRLIGMWSSVNGVDKEAKKLECRIFESIKFHTHDANGDLIQPENRVSKDLKFMSRSNVGEAILTLPWGLGAVEEHTFRTLLRKHRRRFEQCTSLRIEDAMLERPFLIKVPRPEGELSKWIMHSGYAEAWKSVNSCGNARVTEMLAHGLRVLWTPDQDAENAMQMSCRGDHKYDNDSVDAGVERVFWARAFLELQSVSMEDEKLEDSPGGDPRSRESPRSNTLC